MPIFCDRGILVSGMYPAVFYSLKYTKNTVVDRRMISYWRYFTNYGNVLIDDNNMLG